MDDDRMADTGRRSVELDDKTCELVRLRGTWCYEDRTSLPVKTSAYVAKVWVLVKASGEQVAGRIH